MMDIKKFNKDCSTVFHFFFIEQKLKTRHIKQIKTTINTACAWMRKKEGAALFVCLFDQVEGKDRLILYK